MALTFNLGVTIPRAMRPAMTILAADTTQQWAAGALAREAST